MIRMTFTGRVDWVSGRILESLKVRKEDIFDQPLLYINESLVIHVADCWVTLGRCRHRTGEFGAYYVFGHHPVSASYASIEAALAAVCKGEV